MKKFVMLSFLVFCGSVHAEDVEGTVVSVEPWTTQSYRAEDAIFQNYMNENAPIQLPKLETVEDPDYKYVVVKDNSGQLHSFQIASSFKPTKGQKILVDVKEL